MTSARHDPTTASPLEASSDILPSLTHPLFVVQRAQWEALLAWQQSLDHRALRSPQRDIAMARIGRDGEKKLPDAANYGVQALRAMEITGLAPPW